MDGRLSTNPLRKMTRWCVLKRKENLTSQQQFGLRDLLRYNLQTVRAYLVQETIGFCIEPMKKIARALRVDRKLLLNYFKARKQISSGVVERRNHKARVTMRRF